jgi:lipoprotein-anchoring transpeptidase ErfK/SrfK
MRSRTFILVAGLLVALLVLAGGVYAYDTGRNDLIAKGVRVGGIDVGGLRAHDARKRLADQLLTPLRQPVVASHGEERFTLTPEEARVGVDIDGSVDRALARSRSGNLLARTVRGLTGETVQAELPVDVNYDPAAVDRLVKSVEKSLERPATNADVDFDDGHVQPRPSHSGVAVRANLLRRDVVNSLTRLRAPRALEIQTRRVKPKITTDQLAERYPAVLIVNRDAFRLTLYKNLKPAKTYRIAVGQAGLDTPAGLYKIENKAENPAWHVPDSDWAGKLRGKVIPADDPRNPIEARWMAIYNGAGIHGTTAINSLGTRASHGCVRMAIPDVIELYDQVPVASPVYIL